MGSGDVSGEEMVDLFGFRGKLFPFSKKNILRLNHFEMDPNV